ncbi:tyrosine-type recombinase/integrase [Lentzea nigeriaca]
MPCTKSADGSWNSVRPRRPPRAPATVPCREAGGEVPINQEMHFHDLRHTHETWLVEEKVPRVLRLERLGHERKDVDDDYSHVTDVMIARMLAALQHRWEIGGGWSWDRQSGLKVA